METKWLIKWQKIVLEMQMKVFDFCNGMDEYTLYKRQTIENVAKHNLANGTEMGIPVLVSVRNLIYQIL